MIVRLLIIMVSLHLFWCNSLQSLTQKKGYTNELHRIFHHQSIDAQVSTESGLIPHIDVGQVVVYFNQEPIVNKIPRIPSALREEVLELFFPGATLSKSLLPQELEKSMINGSTKKPFYTVTFEATKTPIMGVKCFITFDKNFIAFDYDVFRSISNQHAVRLRFLNKVLLKKMGKENCLLKVACNKPCVILDCGHGGKDTGAIGVGRVLEKEITLSIGLTVAQLLKEKGFEVCMTRDQDIDVALDRRTSFANTINNATAMISIHANASTNPSVCGIETFYVEPSLFKHKEQFLTSHDAQLVEQYQQKLHYASAHLAQEVHQQVIKIASHQKTTCDRHIKPAASQVLVGTNIPSILIEVGFVSNPSEATFLSEDRYRKLVAEGICRGITSYHTAASRAFVTAAKKA